MGLKQVTMQELGIELGPRGPGRNPRRFMNWGEPESLLALAKMSPGEVFVEIGVNEGLTADFLLCSLPSIKWYFGVDVFPGYITQREVQRREIPTTPGQYALRHDRFSLALRHNGSLDLHKSDLPKGVDFMFIDGDHGQRAVIHDTLLAAESVKDDGVVVWHDYHHLGTVDVADVLDKVDAGCGTLKHISGTWIAYASGADLRKALVQGGGKSQ